MKTGTENGHWAYPEPIFEKKDGVCMAGTQHNSWDREQRKIHSLLRIKAIDMLVLAMLSRRSMYAREMLRCLAAVTDNVLSYDKLHTPLLRLQRQGLICQTETPPDGYPSRVYFAITQTGQIRLAELVEEYRRFNCAVEKVLGLIQPE